MYLYRLLFLTFLPMIRASNTSHIIEGYDPEIDVPRYLQTGRKHCFNSPNLYCANNRRCCTHVHQKKIWCCDRKHACGKIPHTCVVFSLNMTLP